MLNIKYRFVFLLIYITSNRCIPVCESKSLSLNNDFTQDNQNYENDDFEQTHNWDCSENEETQNEQLITTNKMLEEGESVLKKQNEIMLNKILVLGNAGTGKTTFVQFIAGDNTKLISREVGNDTGEYIIEDNEKIGSSETESFTLYPEELEIDEKIAITDTPGFSDTRSPAHEIITTFVMKKYLKDVTNIKIVLLVTYNSVQRGVYKDDFIDLLRNINSFIKDIDKHKNSIVLIATKVPNTYKYNEKSISLIQDRNIVISIAEYIFQVKKSLQEKLNIIKSNKERSFLENSIKIIDSLLESIDTEGNYKKINIFRRPSESGSLSNITFLQDRKESLKKTILLNSDFVGLTENDIGYTLSDKAKIYLDCLLKYLNRRITKLSSQIFKSFKDYYFSEINNNNDLYYLVDKLDVEIKALEKLKNDLDESNNYKHYSNLINKFVSNLKNSSIIENYKFEMKKLNSYIMKIEQFSSVNLTLSPIIWTSQMKSLLNYMKDEHMWYNFLKLIFEKLSNYKFQESKLKFYNYTTSINENNTKKISILQIFLSNSQFLMDENFNSYFNQIKFDDKRLRELEEVISATVKLPINVVCDNEKLLVTGNFIRTSEISEDYIIRHYCGDKQIKAIIINAVHTVFIDSDMEDEIFRGMNMMIAAPTWEIIGTRKIMLDGLDGKVYNENRKTFPDNNSIIDHLSDYGKIGADGKPGLPGQNGGNFFGVGLYFNNGNQLTISTNGGNGGPGENGEDGKNGKPGKDGVQLALDDSNNPRNLFFSVSEGYRTYRDALELSEFINITSICPANPSNSAELEEIQEIEESSYYLFTCRGQYKIYKLKGTTGSAGGKGGNGGTGGFGGNPGETLILQLKDNSNIKLINETGNIGIPGIGGNGGKQGTIGSTITCIETYISLLTENTKYRCFNSRESCEPLEIKTSENGKSGINEIGILEPNEKINPDFKTDLLNYVIILEEKKTSKLFSNISSIFKKEILKRNFGTLENDSLRLALLNDNLDAI